ncbi:hypothetical protein [Anaerosporobacter sp.]|uniref:hypothetical protein n=1 Tax=Anaerosporobacter sp. TaxID=1872529 RepID=UPI00286EF8EA|nr:hypothetical protein [Anaerosporobacter sp.]
MDKGYKETPDNFSEIEPYVITEKESIISSIIKAKRCYFYDTCAFRNHMLIPNPELIYEYIEQTAGIVIITRCIIMELCSGDSRLWKEHIAYIQKMNQYGIRVLVLYEEDMVQVLKACYSDMLAINKMLSLAIRCVKSKAGTIEKTLNRNPNLTKELFHDSSNRDSYFAERLFQAIRDNKSSKDNLGEELIAVCVHLLANIREVEPFKYMVFTDDKGAIAILGKAMQNVEKYIGMKCISALTTSKLCWLMKEKNIVLLENEITDILSAGNCRDSMKVYCSEMYELAPSEKSMSIAEFARKIMEENIRVYS